MRRLLLLGMIFSCASLLAQKVKTVSAEYTYYAPEAMSVEEAKRTTLERAKIQAIADEFGTNVSQSNSTIITNVNGETDTKFFSFGGSDVKGEWIETIGEPKFDIRHEKNLIVVIVHVKGKVREKVTSQVNLNITPLRNGVDSRYASMEFKDGDEFYLNFTSPAKGYLSVWLITDNGKTAFRLLPYQRSVTETYPIEPNKEYTFFSPAHSSPKEIVYVDEFEMSVDNDIEFNELYVIYSPNAYSTVVQKISDERVYYASSKSFKEWLAKLQKNTNDIVVKTFQLKIIK